MVALQFPHDDGPRAGGVLHGGGRPRHRRLRQEGVPHHRSGRRAACGQRVGECDGGGGFQSRSYCCSDESGLLLSQTVRPELCGFNILELFGMGVPDKQTRRWRAPENCVEPSSGAIRLIVTSVNLRTRRTESCNVFASPAAHDRRGAQQREAPRVVQSADGLHRRTREAVRAAQVPVCLRCEPQLQHFVRTISPKLPRQDLSLRMLSQKGLP